MLVHDIAFGKVAEKKKKKGSVGKAVAIGAGTALGVGAAKGLAEKTLEPILRSKVRKTLEKIPKGRKILRGILRRAPWSIARGITSAGAAVGYTLGTLKAVEAARGEK